MIFQLENLLEEAANSTNSDTQGAFSGQNLILWIVLIILVLIIVFFFIFSWVKERIEKKKIAQATHELRKNTVIYWYELSCKLRELLEINSTEQEKFQPSIGKFKMSDLNTTARKLIEDEIKSDRFQACFQDTEEHMAFVRTVFELKDTNSNLWDKKLPLDREYFDTAIAQAIEAAKSYQEKDYFDLRNQDELAEEIRKEYYEKLNKQS
ncbi:MHJ_0274 family protein [Mycoplasma buteonis]|uniref:MHJ_0274 family protein n=1 Tax=Mycoplasma buteonis TaxID=171280 RepID=UPI00068AC706|nr:hypothetical protein [Mycoplasma buteonis]